MDQIFGGFKDVLVVLPPFLLGKGVIQSTNELADESRLGPG